MRVLIYFSAFYLLYIFFLLSLSFMSLHHLFSWTTYEHRTIGKEKPWKFSLPIYCSYLENLAHNLINWKCFLCSGPVPCCHLEKMRNFYVICFRKVTLISLFILLIYYGTQINFPICTIYISCGAIFIEVHVWYFGFLSSKFITISLPFSASVLCSM